MNQKEAITQVHRDVTPLLLKQESVDL